MKTIILAAVLCVFASLREDASATTYNAASCSSTHVQAAINSATDGDTVTVPAGSCTWSTVVTITNGIRLIGAGIDQTVITQGIAGPILTITGNGQYQQVNGFTWTGNAGAHYAGMIQFTGSSGPYRFFNNKISCVWPAIAAYGTDTRSSLIDSNQCLATGGNFVAIFGTTNAWTYGTTYGSTNTCCIEHNQITMTGIGDGAIDCYNGAKWVFRYNNLTNAMIGWHGCDSGSYRSPHSFEIYGNTFVWTNGGYYAGIQSRGGTGLIYSNNFVGTFGGSAIYLQYFRYGGASSICASDLGNCPPWGSMTGTNRYDGNTLGDGYPGLDQTGRTGPTTFTATNSTQVLSPLYAWGNTPTNLFATINSQSTNSILNRDYYNGTIPGGFAQLVDPHPMAGGVSGGATVTNWFIGSTQTNYAPCPPRLTATTNGNTITPILTLTTPCAPGGVTTQTLWRTSNKVTTITREITKQGVVQVLENTRLITNKAGAYTLTLTPQIASVLMQLAMTNETTNSFSSVTP